MNAERTPDGRFVVVEGRRWRATDPAVPEKLRAELVGELMSARRAVRAGEDGARARVQDAKVALGERGDPWWEPTAVGRAARLEAAMCALLRHRTPHATICPSDAARVAGGERWRDCLDDARAAADRLRREGLVRVTQRGEEVDPLRQRGPLRIGRGPRWPDVAGEHAG